MNNQARKEIIETWPFFLQFIGKLENPTCFHSVRENSVSKRPKTAIWKLIQNRNLLGVHSQDGVGLQIMSMKPISATKIDNIDVQIGSVNSQIVGHNIIDS